MAFHSVSIAVRKPTIFRPILAWLTASALLFACEYHLYKMHHATIQFTVSVEGRTKPPQYQATLNGAPFDSGKSSGLGQRKLTIEAEDAEPFVTNIFVWYGGKDIHDVRLVRSRGILELKVRPGAEQMIVRGAETNSSFSRSTYERLSLPTGNHTVVVQFARFSTTQDVSVLRQRVTPVTIDAGLTTLQLTSQPTNAEFELNCIQHPAISIRSNTPASIADLPGGDYSLRIWHGDYTKNIPVRLKAIEATNEATVVFDYAQLTITSDPSGADVSDAQRQLAVTPDTLNLRPGSYRFTISKEGFRATNVVLTLAGSGVGNLSVKLTSLAFLAALERAAALSSFPPDDERALAEVEKALSIQPEDSTALALRRTIQFDLHFHKAKLFESRRDYLQALLEIDAALKLRPDSEEAIALKSTLQQFEHDARQAAAEVRRNHPMEVFQTVCGQFPHNELFTPQLMRFTNSLETVRAGILRALGRKPAWKVGRDEKVDADTVAIQAGLWSFTERQTLALVIGQPSDEQVVLHFRLYQEVLDSKIQLNLKGVTDESYVPLHPQRVSSLRAPFAEKQRAAAIQELKKRIEDELH